MRSYSYWTFPFPEGFRRAHDGMEFATGKFIDVLWTWMIGGYWDKGASPAELARMSVNFDILIGEAAASLAATAVDIERIAAPAEGTGNKEAHLLRAALLSLGRNTKRLLKQVSVLRAAIAQGPGRTYPEKGHWPVDYMTLKVSVRKVQATYDVVFDTLVMAIRERTRR